MGDGSLGLAIFSVCRVGHSWRMGPAGWWRQDGWAEKQHTLQLEMIFGVPPKSSDLISLSGILGSMTFVSPLAGCGSLRLATEQVRGMVPWANTSVARLLEY